MRKYKHICIYNISIYIYIIFHSTGLPISSTGLHFLIYIRISIYSYYLDFARHPSPSIFIKTPAASCTAQRHVVWLSPVALRAERLRPSGRSWSSCLTPPRDQRMVCASRKRNVSYMRKKKIYNLISLRSQEVADGEFGWYGFGWCKRDVSVDWFFRWMRLKPILTTSLSSQYFPIGALPPNLTTRFKTLVVSNLQQPLNVSRSACQKCQLHQRKLIFAKLQGTVSIFLHLRTCRLTSHGYHVSARLFHYTNLLLKL